MLYYKCKKFQEKSQKNNIASELTDLLSSAILDLSP